MNWRLLILLSSLTFALPQASGEALLPLAPPPTLNARSVELGKILFHDVRLSLHNDVSCASCHPIAKGGADGTALSRGTGGSTTTYNTPTILNASLVFKYGWEGVATSFQQATQRALESPRAMGLPLAEAVKRLQPSLGPLEGSTVLKALMDYMTAAVPRSAPFDRFLQGDPTALTPEQKKGYERFIELGCSSCHQGASVGGNMFVRFGVMYDPFREQPDEHRGRFNHTGQEEDRHVFRVPSLRNVSLTAPYFHDGRAPDLSAAIRTMGYVQLGVQLTEKDVALLQAFLISLTGDIPAGVLP